MRSVISPRLRLRRMTETDLDFADHLRGLVGWNQTRADWMRFMAAEPEGCFVAELGGTRVGTATTLRYGDDLSWIGMVLVHPDHRNQGVGRALLHQGIQFLRDSGVRRIRLDATPLGRPIYEALGFRAEFGLTRWDGVVGASIMEDSARLYGDLRRWQPGDAERVEGLDRPAFGAVRRGLLESLGQVSTAGWVAGEEPRQVEGFGFIRPGAMARYLGPVVARSEEVGLRLVKVLLAGAKEERVFWDIPDFQDGMTRWAEARGFRKQRGLTRMVLGPPEEAGEMDLTRQLAISGPETG